MVTNLVLINSKKDFDKIPNEFFNKKNFKIYALNSEAHKVLETNKISHEIADRLISQEERTEIYDYSVKISDWYNHDKLYELFAFKKINLLSLLDGIEFQSLLVKHMLNYKIILEILKTENPKNVFTNSILEEYFKNMQEKEGICLKIWQSEDTDNSLWEKISFKKRIGKIPISFNISRKKYFKIKNLIERAACSTLNLWFNLKNAQKETILFVEFDPSQYSDLFLEISKISNKNIVCYNHRNPIFRDLKGMKILKKSNVKILDHKKFITKKDDELVEREIKRFYKNLKNIFEDKTFFEIFTLNQISFWPIIRRKILEILQERVSEYMRLTIASRKLLEEINFKKIIILNEIGETEKMLISCNKNRIPTILLQHGYTDYNHETSRFDYLSGYSSVNDYIAVWGETQKEYLMNENKILPEKILVTGSPRHDKFFKNIKQIKQDNKTLLLALRPITEISAEDSTDLHIAYEQTLKKIYELTKKYSNVNLIVKLHPIQLGHNEELLEFFKKLDPEIHIEIFSPVFDILQKSDAVISISPENWDISTIVLESQILEKPVLNIFLKEDKQDFQCVRDGSVLAISHNEDINRCIEDILFNEEKIKRLKHNTKKHLKLYLSNHGVSSKVFSKIIDQK